MSNLPIENKNRALHTQASLKKRLKKYRVLYLLTLPAVIYLIVNNYMPMIGLTLAFKKYSFAKGIFGSAWCGLKNFSFLFGSKWASIMFRNTIGYNLVFIVTGTVFAIFVAILLDSMKRARLRNTCQILILVPHLISMVLVGYIVFAFLSYDNGFANKSVLEPLGVEAINWYTNDQYWPFILTIVNLWKGFGFQSIVYYAAILGFDKSYYEAAVVDGASIWQQITRITLPLLKPTIIILSIMAVGRMFFSDFGLFYQVPMDVGTLYEATTTIDTFVYRTLMNDHNVGRSLAAGFLQSILGFVMVLATNLIVRRIEPESALF